MSPFAYTVGRRVKISLLGLIWKGSFSYDIMAAHKIYLRANKSHFA
jgi:hypothetical protein